MASGQQNNAELVEQATAAQIRAQQLESEVAQLRVEAQAAEETEAKVAKQVNVRFLNEYRILISPHTNGGLAAAERLDELGVFYEFADLKCPDNEILIYTQQKGDNSPGAVLARAIDDVVSDPRLWRTSRADPDQLLVCAIL